MRLTGKTIEFDNGLSLTIGESFNATKEKINHSLINDVDEELLSFKSESLIDEKVSRVCMLFNVGDTNGLYSISLDVDINAFAQIEKYETYEAFADDCLRCFAEVRDYLLKEISDGQVVADEKNCICIIKDDVSVGLTTGREVEFLHLSFEPK